MLLQIFILQSLLRTVELKSDFYCIVDDFSECPCPSDKWVYSSENGGCFFVGDKLKSYDEAVNICKNIDSKLVSISNTIIYKYMSKLLKKLDNHQKKWALRESTEKSCKTFELDNIWKPGRLAVNQIECNSLQSYVCYKSTEICDMNTLNDASYNKQTMEFNPGQINVGQKSTLYCKKGSYMTCSGIIFSSPLSTYRCDYIGKKAIAKKIEKKICNKPECKVRQCSRFPFSSLEYVVKRPPDVKSASFGTRKEFTCANGYETQFVKKSNKGYIECIESSKNVADGSWHINKCIPIKCNYDEMLKMTPSNGKLVEAKHQTLDITYRDWSLKQFPQYDFVVSIACPVGYMFPNRKTMERIICKHKKNDPFTGQWEGFMETVMPIAKVCKESSCKSESVVISSSRNIKKSFQIKIKNVARTVERHEKGDYPSGTILIFDCAKGYQTADQDTQQKLKCSSSGKWIPNISDCFNISGSINTGNNNYYIPVAKEAEVANNVGLLAIIIIVLFIVFMAILDIVTLLQDYPIF